MPTLGIQITHPSATYTQKKILIPKRSALLPFPALLRRRSSPPLAPPGRAANQSEAGTWDPRTTRATMQKLAVVGTGEGGEDEYAMLETLMMQGESASVGAPRFDGKDFQMWQARMKTHLQAFNLLVWSIVETGFSCADEANPTALELRNIHCNAQAMNAIYCALSDDKLYRIWHLDSAKEVWDTLQVIHEDTPIVREFKVKRLREKMKLFAWRKHELPTVMYVRLENLAAEMRRLGCQEVTDSYVVRKMLCAMAPRNSSFEAIIRERPNFEELTPLDVLNSFQVHDMWQQESKIIREYEAKVDTTVRSEPSYDAHCSGEVPYFDGTHYLSWQHRMKFHLLSIHPLLWRIVETGFSCVDEANPTALEKRNRQYNALANGALSEALSRDQFMRIRNYKSAKEIWDALRKFNGALRESKLGLLRIHMDRFALGKHESPNDMYARLNDLVNEMKGLGCKEMTDSYVVRKMLRAMAPRNPNLVFLIREKPNFELLTPQDVLAAFFLYNMDQKQYKISSGKLRR
ncbi:uncharacterized protein LOC123413129 isoform X2 [Hordeum vulgare subsp. vulgare]|uniref:uncharacterized protein LOC123413129 isoform X2 n=1 Tax=Hordeum vulgare subsp. vulgare TaxID=112509 RepID=UPI001D1A39D3|nr:uncharacterized protein LOC123413129 isoform X2 [Hordeum vulgare subsp. vulgare]